MASGAHWKRPGFLKARAARLRFRTAPCPDLCHGEIVALKRIVENLLSTFIRFNQQKEVVMEFRGEMLGVKELARYLGIAEVTVYRLLKKQELPAKKVGKQWRIRNEDLDKWLVATI